MDPVRCGPEQGHRIVLVAQPIDERPAVEYDFDILTGGRVADGCSERLGLEFVDKSGEGFFEMRMGRVAVRIRRASMKQVVKGAAGDPPVSGDGVGRR